MSSVLVQNVHNALTAPAQGTDTRTSREEKQRQSGACFWALELLVIDDEDTLLLLIGSFAGFAKTPKFPFFISTLFCDIFIAGNGNNHPLSIPLTVPFRRCFRCHVLQKLQLENTIRLSEVSTATRRRKPTASEEPELAAAATRDESVQRMLSTGGRSADRGNSRGGGRSGTCGGRKRSCDPTVRKESALAGAAIRDAAVQRMLSEGRRSAGRDICKEDGRSGPRGGHQNKPAFSKERARAAAAKRDEVIEQLISDCGLGTGRGQSGGTRSSGTRGGRGGRGGRGDRGAGRDNGVGERSPTIHARNARVPSLEEETESLQEKGKENEEEEEEAEEEKEEEREKGPADGSSDAESAVVFRSERARGPLHRQVNQGTGERKRKEAPNPSDEGMDPSRIVGLVGKHIMDRMDNDGGGIGAVRRQVNQRLDLMAAEHKRALDRLEAQQNVMSDQLSALLRAFSQSRATGAAPPPFPYSALQPHAAHMASLPRLGVQADYFPPCSAMTFGGIAGPYGGGGGVTVGRQAGGVYLAGVRNAGAAMGFVGAERMAGQQQQGRPAGGEGGAVGLEEGKTPVPAFGT